MSFTIKHRFYQPVAIPPSPCDPFGSVGWTPIDTIMGPFEHVKAHFQDGAQVVVGSYAGENTPGYTFDQEVSTLRPTDSASLINDQPPRAQIWVMNDAGATVASYTL